MKSLVFDILNSTVNNVERFVSCAADQFAGTLLNSIIGVLETLFESPLAGVAKLLQFFSDFNLGNILREGIGVLSEFGAGFACNQSLDNYKGLVNEWTVGGGPSGSVSSTASSLVGTYGNIRDITNIISSGVDINSVTQCFTGALQFASPPAINIFGGRGSGASAIPIFGNLVTNPDGNTTASIIGVQLTNPGSGYAYSPFVEIIDDADQGYGAVARALVNESGQVESIYMVSEGENYSVGNLAEFSVLRVLVEDGGSGYEDVVVTDNLGNEYNSQIVDGRISQVIPLNNIVDSLPRLNIESDTGFGAILRPVIGALKETGSIPASPDADPNSPNSANLFAQEVQTSIDCPI
jgi:hypothetical protein